MTHTTRQMPLCRRPKSGKVCEKSMHNSLVVYIDAELGDINRCRSDPIISCPIMLTMLLNMLVYNGTGMSSAIPLVKHTYIVSVEHRYSDSRTDQVTKEAFIYCQMRKKKNVGYLHKSHVKRYSMMPQPLVSIKRPMNVMVKKETQRKQQQQFLQAWPTVYLRYHILVILVCLIFFCSWKIPNMRASAVGGQPGT